MSALPKTSSIPPEEAGRFLEVARMLSDIPQLPQRKRQIYGLWIVGYLRFLERQNSGKPSPQNLHAFLEQVASRDGVEEPVRQQAAEALVFYHECMLRQQVGETNGRLHVMSEEERDSILRSLNGPEKLLARVVFETELDLTEALRLRVGDVNVHAATLTVSDAMGCTDRIVDISTSMAEDLQQHLKRVKSTHEADLEKGGGLAEIPKQVQERFEDAGRMWVWQFVFPSDAPTLDLRSGEPRRYPMQPTRLIEALEQRTAPMTRMQQEDTADEEGVPETIFEDAASLELEGMIQEATSLSETTDTPQHGESDDEADGANNVSKRAASHIGVWKPTYL